MCNGRTARSQPAQTTAHSAEVFARGTVAALLSAEDWGICDAVAAEAHDMVAHAAERVIEVSVIVHRDSVEVLVAGGGAYTRREVLADTPFATPIDCDLP